MTFEFQCLDNSEFAVRIIAEDRVTIEEVARHNRSLNSVELEDVALYVVARFLDGAGPNYVLANLTDGHGITHEFDVGTCGNRHGWHCEALPKDFPDLTVVEEPSAISRSAPDTLAHSGGFDLTDIPDEAFDGLSTDQQRDLVRASARAVRTWSEDLRRRGIW